MTCMECPRFNKITARAFVLFSVQRTASNLRDFGLPSTMVESREDDERSEFAAPMEAPPVRCRVFGAFGGGINRVYDSTTTS